MNQITFNCIAIFPIICCIILITMLYYYYHRNTFSKGRLVKHIHKNIGIGRISFKETGGDFVWVYWPGQDGFKDRTRSYIYDIALLTKEEEKVYRQKLKQKQN